ncbi:AAA family ATPase [Barnesiella intestinihominis]|uniref:AAA family ATPase n=1 Tax=Barnesiella intestinihominis TaxID=487174 RepID=UPI003F20515C
MKQTENEMNVNVPLEVIKASEIEPKEVKWLWYPYIPFGKVTLLQGDPGDGKSKLMLSIAALLSKGEPLPFTETEETEPMTIIYQTTEVWELVTPYFEKRNIHFYVNKCGFHIVEFFCKYHVAPETKQDSEVYKEEYFRFEKRMRLCK